MQILYVRHGLVDPKIIAGRKANLPLTREGHNQMFKRGETLAKYQPTLLITSPLLRAVQSAEEVKRGLAKHGVVTDIMIEEGLTDVYCPALDGEPAEKLQLVQTGQLSVDSEPPEEIIGRVKEVFDKAFFRFFGKTVGFVTHLDVINTWLAYQMYGVKEVDFSATYIGRGEVWPVTYNDRGQIINHERPKSRRTEWEY